MTSTIEAYQSNGGARIYRIPLELFPILSGYAHLVFTDDIIALIDVGSGFGESNDQLEEGMKEIHSRYGELATWEDLTHVLITHGHIDHFGGLPYVRDRTEAKIGIHELDLRVLANFEERLKIVEHRLRVYLVEAGVEVNKREGIMTLYMLNKHLYSSLAPDFTYDSVGMRLGPFRIFHVPGHCPGHVVIQLDDVLFSGDHVLKKTTPHQAPESLSLNTGLGHYLESLRLVRRLSDEIHLVLGGHEGPIYDLGDRIREIESLHLDRLEQILDLLKEPLTVAQISHALFPEVEGYHELLALEEAGAHVEYLVQRGYLGIDNLDELNFESPAPIRYKRTEGTGRLEVTFNAEHPEPAIASEGISLANPSPLSSDGC
ncbi:MAG TPA: MBL fold metallo-hydrolase [Anaerolineae bacterium]|nr:MBL fold metallo-hydrolase [Anaerolineae bacterium]